MRAALPFCWKRLASTIGSNSCRSRPEAPTSKRDLGQRTARRQRFRSIRRFLVGGGEWGELARIARQIGQGFFLFPASLRLRIRRAGCVCRSFGTKRRFAKLPRGEGKLWWWRRRPSSLEDGSRRISGLFVGGRLEEGARFGVLRSQGRRAQRRARRQILKARGADWLILGFWFLVLRRFWVDGLLRAVSPLPPSFPEEKPPPAQSIPFLPKEADDPGGSTEAFAGRRGERANGGDVPTSFPKRPQREMDQRRAPVVPTESRQEERKNWRQIGDFPRGFAKEPCAAGRCQPPKPRHRNARGLQKRSIVLGRRWLCRPHRQSPSREFAVVV